MNNSSAALVESSMDCANACAALPTEAEKLAFLAGYSHGIRQTNAKWKTAIAAGSGTAKTAKPVECGASQSGPQGIAQNTPPPNRGDVAS